jgi:hypothetical protein
MLQFGVMVVKKVILALAATCLFVAPHAAAAANLLHMLHSALQAAYSFVSHCASDTAMPRGKKTCF